MNKEIKNLWAWIIDDDGNGVEGIITMHLPGIAMPMVASDRVKIDQLRGMAKDVAKATGQTVRLVRFENRVNIEEICNEQTQEGKDTGRD